MDRTILVQHVLSAVGHLDDIERAFADVQAILSAERLKRERQTGLSTFVRGLQAKL